MDFIKIENFCSEKDDVNSKRRQVSDGRKYLQKTYLIRRRQWHPTPVLLPGESHGWKSLVGCSPWDCYESDDWETSLSLFTFMHWRRKWQPTPVFLPGESHAQRSLVGYSPWDHRAGHDWSDWARIVYQWFSKQVLIIYCPANNVEDMCLIKFNILILLIFGSLRVGHDWTPLLSFFTFMHWRRKWQPTPVFLPGESQGRGSLVGCRLWGRTELDMTEVT